MKREKYFALSPRIARWKIDTIIENYLGHMADNSEFWKKIYLAYYNLFDHKYHAVGCKMAADALKTYDVEKYAKDSHAVVRDMIYCLHRFGYSFQDYCIYDFINNKDIEYRTSFVADKLRYHYCDMLNSHEVYHIMTNKYTCYKNYKKFYKRDVVGCISHDDFKKFIDFTARHRQFIYKPLEDHSGRGIEIFDVKDIDTTQFFNHTLSQGPFVVEELIQQGEETARIHPQSVNTCRVLTFAHNSHVDIIATTWRVGSGRSIKDNAGSGGIYACINPQSGVVETDAQNYQNHHFAIHPNTGIAFIGYQMPQWNDAIAMIKEMALNIQGSTLIAWDIAYSTNGWVMVEANENGDWSIVQSNKKIGLKNILFTHIDRYFNA